MKNVASFFLVVWLAGGLCLAALWEVGGWVLRTLVARVTGGLR